MKKIIVVLSIIFTLSVILVGCGKKEVVNPVPQTNTNQPEVQQTATTQATGNQMVTNPKELFSYLDLTQEQLIAALGKNYKIEEYNKEEGTQLGYNYKDLGIKAIYSKNNAQLIKPLEINCDNTVTVNGAHSGMTFAQIQEKLGNAYVKMAPISDYEEGGVGVYYKMMYRINDIALIFESDKKDGETSLKITKHVLDIANIEAEKVLGITAENELASASWETKMNGKDYYPVIILKVDDGLAKYKDNQTYYVDTKTYKVYKMDEASKNLILLNK